MEPTRAEWESFRGMQDAADWAGLTDAQYTLILAELGDPISFREVAAIPLTTYSACVNAIRLGDPASPFTARIVGLAQMFHRACVLSMTPVSTPGVTTLAIPTAPAHTSNPKMSSLVDSTIDSEVSVLKKGRIETMFSDYRTSRGEFPSPDIEPTDDQLSAVTQLIDSGAVPYVDFAIFGPYGRRLLRKLTLIAYHYNAPDGSWKKQDLPGPPDFESWWKSWLVLKCTLLLLDAVQPERLEHYGEHLRSFINTYGAECWFIIYQADVRMRSEQFERLRRRLHIDLLAGTSQHGFTASKPWDGVFAAAVKDKEFWDSEVREKAILYLAKVATFRDISYDGTSQSSRGPPHSSSQYPPQQKGQGHQGQKRKNRQEPVSKGGKPNSKPPRGGKGQETCNNWNLNKCTMDPCPRAHVCNICFGHHKKDQCHKGGQQGGKGGGKPRRGKGGK